MDYNINNLNVNTFQGIKKMDNDMEDMTFQDQVDEIVQRVAEKVEDNRIVPEYGEFSPVNEFMPNYDESTSGVVGKYGLKVYKMPKDVVKDPKQRYIEAAAYMPAGDYKADMIVGSGYKDEILKQLRDPEFPEKLNKAYGELLDTLENE
ncbi:MAG: hypothetical protein NC200_05920 [Candidatus Gastranaerophilales bacterium]|nr:hypothetical protein [Candidatus Gastranaerophilales bacterium]